MSTLRRACIIATATPVVLVSCVDLGTLATVPPDEAGTSIEVEGGAASTTKCPPGQKSCAGGCVPNNLIDYGCAADSCARCSVLNSDTTICEEGKCAVGKCAPGFGSCDGNTKNGCEADLTTAATCGSCTVSCPATTPFCSSGQCVKDCEIGTTQCGSQCVDLQTTATHCGSCENVCARAPNAAAICVKGLCDFKCNSGFGDCDKNLINGCESLTPYYVDADGDGVGGGAIVGIACAPPPGNSLVAGDCLDSNDKVKPGQAAFFFTGYTTADGKISYDYDCNGTEEREPTKPVGDCTMCRAGDYLKVVRPVAPANADLYCGSGTHIAFCNGSSSCSATSSASTLGCR